MTALVGLDVGTTGVKALALSPDGEVLATATRVYELSTPRPGWTEQAPEDWWRAAEAALAEVAAGRDVAGIGLSGQMHGLVVLDDAGRVIRPAILWNDQRTARECAEIEDRVGLERLLALTGNRALTGFTAPKLLWLRHHEPEAYARIARVMLPKDYVRLRLTGEWAIDASDASGTLLLDVAERRWSDEVLDALELPRHWLPPVLESPERAGETCARDTVSPGTPVAAGAGDQPAAAVGVGATAPGRLSVVLGTSGVVLAPPPDARATRVSTPSSRSRSRESRRPKATPSRTARTSAPRSWRSSSPTNAPLASGSAWGVRSPARYGRKSRPSAPGSQASASSTSLSNGTSGATTSWSQRSDPAADSITPIACQVRGTAWQKAWTRASASCA